MMGNLAFMQKLCISVCWGLLMFTAAERQYFIISHNATWEQARNHCQVCFKEMVTLTPENIQIVAKIINTEHWIGLRKYINYSDTFDDDFDSIIEPDNSTNSSGRSFGTPWTWWANGDPLVFQNWYPGYPVFKSPLPKIDCCSCSCTCPVPVRTTTSPPTVPTVTGYTNSNPARRATGPENITTNSYENMTRFTRFDSLENMTFDLTNFTVETNDFENMTFDLTNFTVETNDFENMTADPMNVTMETNSSENMTTGTNFALKTSGTRSWETTQFDVHTTDSPWTTKPKPIVSTCEREPMLPPVVPENNKNYIENSCVVILGFGPWVERLCSEQLPFICYEDRFMGNVNVSGITSSSAFLQWEEGPGDLSHYRFEVVAPETSWSYTLNLTRLSFKLENLTAGSLYKVQVIAVKCYRDLNPQNSSFYTIPGKVKNIIVTNVDETSVSLRWRKPDGNYGFFRVEACSTPADKKLLIKTKNESLVFEGLTQGSNYTFVFTTGVDDESMWSENSSISACTKPGKVAHIKVYENGDKSLNLSWDPPEGLYAGFEVKAFDKNMRDLNARVENLTDLRAKPYKVSVEGLPNGNEINLSVKVWSDCNLTGEVVTSTAYTAPGPISNLTLSSSHNYLEADWNFNPSHGNVSKFTAKLFLNGASVEEKSTSTTNVMFKNLKTATEYKVAVYAVIENLKSPERSSSIFTLPSPPTMAVVASRTNKSLTFSWSAPENSSATDYICSLKSGFWGTSDNKTVINATHCSFNNLKSGSTYDFEVYTLSDGERSESAKCKGTTVEIPMEISLSMLCSSEQPLLCDRKDTREFVFEELKQHFWKHLEGNIFYQVKDTSKTEI